MTQLLQSTGRYRTRGVPCFNRSKCKRHAIIEKENTRYTGHVCLSKPSQKSAYSVRGNSSPTHAKIAVHVFGTEKRKLNHEGHSLDMHIDTALARSSLDGSLQLLTLCAGGALLAQRRVLNQQTCASWSRGKECVKASPPSSMEEKKSIKSKQNAWRLMYSN